jgi:hypothetical protein
VKEILDILSSAILSKYTTFTSGEGAVRKLEGVDILTNFEGNDYAGVSDTKPNSFYIRYSGKTNYVSQKRGARIQFYSAISLCRIVGIYRNGNAAELLQTLINGVTGQGHVVTSSNIEATTVFKEETGKDLTDQTLTIVAVDFEITQIINGANCTINPCDC